MDDKAAPVLMPRNLVRMLANNDTAIELLFDHMRNVGICAVMFIAAGWKFRHIAPFAFGAIDGSTESNVGFQG